MLLKESLRPFDDNLWIVFNLEERKYVVTDEPDEQGVNWDRIPKHYAAPFSTQIGVLHITTLCNLACKYCYNVFQDRKPPKDVFKTVESTTQVVKKLHKLASEKGRKLHIEFHGGEPLLKWNIIKGVITDKETKNIASYSVQTNGTLITEDVAIHTSEGLIRLGVSIDGPKHIHDYYRVFHNGFGSYERVIRGINVLKKYDVPFGIITTITPAFLERISPADYVNWLLEIEPSSVKFGTFFPRGRGESLPTLDKRFESAARFIIEVFELLEEHDSKIVVANILRAVQNVVSSRKYMCLRAPCGAGDTMLAVTPDGKVYACEEFAFDENFVVCDNIFECGWKSIESSRAYRILQKDFSLEYSKCRSCPLQMFCGGGCKAKAYYSNGDIYSPYGCALNKLIFKYVLARLFREEKEFVRKVTRSSRKAESIIVL